MENTIIEKKESLIVRFGYMVLLLGLMALIVSIFVTILIPIFPDFGTGDINTKLFRALVGLSISGIIVFAGLLMYFLPRRNKSKLNSK